MIDTSFSDKQIFICDENGEHKVFAKLNDVDLSEAEIKEELDEIALRFNNMFEPITFEGKIKSNQGLRLLLIGISATARLQEQFDRKHRI